ncbi:MAG: T9SS type A sorting domain-containing protein [Saprospiraceae bacterium]|nr:T9SS type A sorting domain-containing protein [Saprospiraceae bacterium]
MVVKNYLPLSLDISTLQMGASSHPYHYKITQDREIVMTFQNILLVDSTKNETASHGFVKYNIRPSADLEDEDQILNEANIFFDFNPAIKTNEAKHTVGSNFIISKTYWIDKPFDAKFYPNPAQQQIIIDLRDVETKDMTFSVTNVAGQTISQGSLSSGQNMISCQHMSSGRYTVHVFGNGKLSASVSIIKI